MGLIGHNTASLEHPVVPDLTSSSLRSRKQIADHEPELAVGDWGERAIRWWSVFPGCRFRKFKRDCALRVAS
jgi:hypothetical protein